MLLPAGFGALFLILDLVPAEGMRAPSSAPLLAWGVLMTLALRVWFRAEDRWAHHRRLRAAYRMRRLGGARDPKLRHACRTLPS